MLLQQLRHYFETDVIGYGYIELESNKAIKILNFPTLSNIDTCGHNLFSLLNMALP